MTKMTIATDEHGNILGAIQQPNGKESRNGLRADVSFTPGTRVYEVDVGPELDMMKVSNVDKFHEALARHVASAK